MFTRYGAWTNSGPIPPSRQSAPNASAVSRRGPDQALGFEMNSCDGLGADLAGELDGLAKATRRPQVRADPHAT